MQEMFIEKREKDQNQRKVNNFRRRRWRFGNPHLPSVVNPRYRQICPCRLHTQFINTLDIRRTSHLAALGTEAATCGSKMKSPGSRHTSMRSAISCMGHKSGLVQLAHSHSEIRPAIDIGNHFLEVTELGRS
jgi:hypothetical protein